VPSSDHSQTNRPSMGAFLDDYAQHVLKSATKTVDVLCNTVMLSVNIGELLQNSPASVNENLRRRLCLRRVSDALSPEEQSAIDRLRLLNWQIRVPSMAKSWDGYILADSHTAVTFSFTDHLEIEWSTNDPLLVDHFNTIWAGSTSVIYEELLLPSSALAQLSLQADGKRWDNIIQQLARHPADLSEISPHHFEQLVAELLLRSGYANVELTSRTHDGGCDVLVTQDTDLGRHLYFVECKRYHPDNPVGVGLVRALYGVTDAAKATKGVLITTSRFTSGAMAFQRTVRNQISLTDYTQLVTWLRKVSGD
jgi:HJR/Mrr/RecB family endonuclease